MAVLSIIDRNKLLLERRRFADDNKYAAWPEKLREGDNQSNRERGQIAH